MSSGKSPTMKPPTPEEFAKFSREMNAKREEIREQIIGSFEQVAVEGLFIELRMAHAGASRELPEQVSISKCAEMDDRAFFHLVFTHRGGGIGGLLNILHEAQALIMRQLGAGPADLPSEETPSPKQPTGKKKSKTQPKKGRGTKR